MIFEMQINKNR
jgi:hypothetical protein